MSVRTLRAAIVLMLLSGTSLLAADAPTAGKTGTFNVSFTQRSPLTTPKERATRLVEKPAPDDYDLSKSEFVVVVPDSYDPAKPMGLLVLDNYKDWGGPPTLVLDLLAEKNVAFISLTSISAPWDQRCGQFVDAAYNMQQLYKIDPTRVYLFGFDHDYCGPRLVGGYSDVFSGSYLYEYNSFWKPIPFPGNALQEAVMPMPPPKQLGLARANPVGIGLMETESIQPTVNAYRSAGFKNVLGIPASQEDVHYPNFTKPWLEKSIDFLDAKRVQPKTPASRPATRPVH